MSDAKFKTCKDPQMFWMMNMLVHLILQDQPSRKRPKKFLPDQSVHGEYEGTVSQMQTVSLLDIEEAYWEWLERLKKQREVLSGRRN